MFKRLLNATREGASTTVTGKLFQELITLFEKHLITLFENSHLVICPSGQAVTARLRGGSFRPKFDWSVQPTLFYTVIIG